ncbi:cora-like Mg2+ transporter protein-domain-containing protein [Phaeosphaeriaceae sp. PMI808]|nr:cora-like Mg2+ transporter protein-domain-containing protein [Phaeosphaeriaceae sp. PMI808]
MSSLPENGHLKPIQSHTIDIGAWWSPQHIPDGHVYRDTYKHIGDAYDRGQDVADEWEIKDPKRMPYLAHIKSLTPTWRTLRYLSDWMEVGTTPLRWREMQINMSEHEQRINKTNITFIEYQPASAPKTQVIGTPTMLNEVLQSLSHEPGKDTPLRLFVVEDLSQQVIELLGARFDIDPMFFREQIDDYVWYNVRDPWAQARSLMSNMKHRQWFRIRNMRLRYYKTKEDFKEAWKETNSWNVLRRQDEDFNHWNYADSNRAVISIMRTKTSMWIGKDQQCGGGTVGIVLLDPTSSQGQPLWYDRTNWLPTPKMNDPVPTVKQSESWYKDIVNMTKAFPWFEKAEGHDIDMQVLAKPTLYTICAEWLVVCDYVRARLGQIEQELETPGLFRSKGDDIDRSLKRLHTWRRQVPIMRTMIIETLDHALPAAARLTSDSPQSSIVPNSPLSAIHTQAIVTDTSVINFDDTTGYEDIIPDFRRALASANDLQERIDRLSEIVTSQINIEDSRRGLEENHNMARLTWLATIFIPLSFICSMYSMNEDVASLKYTYGWFFLTAVPFTLLVMVIGWFVSKQSHLNVEKKVKSKTKTVRGED